MAGKKVKSITSQCRMVKNGIFVTGSGIGSKNQGISEPIKPQLKFDTSGVGHDPAKEFTHHWWDMAFNKAAKRIKVDTSAETDEVVQLVISSLTFSNHLLTFPDCGQVREEVVQEGEAEGAKATEETVVCTVCQDFDAEQWPRVVHPK